VKVLAAELQAGNPLKAAQLDELGEMLDRALDEAQQVFTQLQPVTPGRDGLMTALARLAAEASLRTPCDFECENAVLIDNPEAALALYRIAEKAVKNALNYAEAGEHQDYPWRPGWSDRTKGERRWPRLRSAGIAGFRSRQRVDAVTRFKPPGGTFTSDSESGHGTTVTFTLPKDICAVQ
jgi:signal transduction histidine kinase